MQLRSTEPPLSRFAVIVLAAGSSTRFARGNKLLEPYKGMALIRHVLNVVDRLAMGRRILVTGGPYRGDMQAILKLHPGWRQCVNDRSTDGVGSSIAAGAQLLGNTDGVFICPGDMPHLQARDFREVARVFRGPGDICRPTMNGEKGHPVLFGRDYYDNLRALQGDRGALSVIQAFSHRLVTWKSSHTGVVLDCDTPEDIA